MSQNPFTRLLRFLLASDMCEAVGELNYNEALRRAAIQHAGSVHEAVPPPVVPSSQPLFAVCIRDGSFMFGAPAMPPDRIIDSGPYRYTRNPMYLGHLIFLTGLALTFQSWFALVILIARAAWFQARVLHDEARLEKIFGAQYRDYRARVKRWIPGLP